MNLAIIILAAFLAYWLGWHHAHEEVSRECRRQGNFYVGKTVYYCDRFEEKADD